VPNQVLIRYARSSNDCQYLDHAGIGRVHSEPVKSGRYQTTSEVVREALRLLERHEQERNEAFQRVKAKLGRGAAQAERGELMDGDEVFEELREMIQERRRAKAMEQ
jgi:antitoxin ParD1/3/4